MSTAVASKAEPVATKGYITDVPYVRGFISSIAPAVLDHVALVRGFAPPARERGFTYCDLGCGQGVTTAVLAATHSAGVFYGIDFMPDHIDHARRFASEASASNAIFHRADFKTAAGFDLPRFDYIVCHGVYAWVNDQVQTDLRHFIDLHLKPGGLVYLSYNALPGWATEFPFQRLVRSLGETVDGDSRKRVTAAIDIVLALAAAKVPALTESFMVKELEARRDRFSPFYLAHEYMQVDWRPLYVTDMRAAMAGIGLMPVGSASLMENFDSYVLGAKARERIASIVDENARELVRDYYLDQRFRRDVFTRDGQKLSQEKQRSRLLNSTFTLRLRSSKVEYVRRTAAGRLSFDNEAARAIVAALQNGPRRLVDIVDTTKLDSQDILANALTLSAAGIAAPVENSQASVSKLNQAIFNRLDGAEPIHLLGSPCGTALSLDAEMLKRLRDNGFVKPETGEDAQPAEIEFAQLLDFLLAQGAST
jgi:SAM-dependent methyltransferase